MNNRINWNDKAVQAFRLWEKVIGRTQGLYYPPFRMTAFVEFLGVEIDDESKGRNLIVPVHNPECQKLIDMILGPNGETILKVMDIRHKERQREADKNTG